MVMQRHEEIKQHRGPRPYVDPTPLRAQGAVFFVFSHVGAWDFHAPAWATIMSPNLVYFKAHPRGFDGGAINWTSRDIKKGDWRDKRQIDRRGDTLGLPGRRA